MLCRCQPKLKRRKYFTCTFGSTRCNCNSNYLAYHTMTPVSDIGKSKNKGTTFLSSLVRLFFWRVLNVPKSQISCSNRIPFRNQEDFEKNQWDRKLVLQRTNQYEAYFRYVWYYVSFRMWLLWYSIHCCFEAWKGIIVRCCYESLQFYLFEVTEWQINKAHFLLIERALNYFYLKIWAES